MLIENIINFCLVYEKKNINKINYFEINNLVNDIVSIDNNIIIKYINTFSYIAAEHYVRKMFDNYLM